MKRTSTAGLLVGLLLTAQPVLAQDEYENGMGELSLNAGFALPLGNAAGTNPLSPSTGSLSESDVINFSVPFGIAIGYRIAGVVFIGGTFTYAPFGSPNSSAPLFSTCAVSGTSCHSTTYHAGFTVQWHPWGSRGLDPYIGVGAGYEWLQVDVSGNSTPFSVQYNGFTWLDVPLGVDFRLSKDIRLGPYLDFMMGEYRNASVTLTGVSGLISPRAIHFWLAGGVRIVFLSL